MNKYIESQSAYSFINELPDQSVDLFLIDPPYFGIVKDSWDNQWKNENDYTEWLINLIKLSRNKIKSNGSLIMFHCMGKHNSHPIFKIISESEKYWVFRNFITWKKRRGYGKTHDYLYCREEIIWFSASSERTQINFNVPLLDEIRGYDGFNKNYKAKSKYKRVSNVWSDINEIFSPERSCQKPIELLDRLILTHSNPKQLVVDFFAGYGTTGISAIKNDRKFLGCEALEEDAIKANQRCQEAFVKYGVLR